MHFQRRLGLLFSLLWLGLMLLILLLVVFLLPAQMKAHLERSLIEDANRLAEFHNSGAVGDAPPIAGGVEVSLYAEDGSALVANHNDPIAPKFLAQITTEAKAFSSPDQIVAAALAPSGRFIVVITQDLGPVTGAIDQIVTMLAIAFIPLLVLGWFGTAYVSKVAIKPVQEAASSISARQGWDTAPVPYHGPQDDLGRIVSEFNRLLGQIDQVRESEKGFLADISHEVRTPLTSLYGRLERIMRRYPQEPEIAAALGSAKHLKRLFDDILFLIRGELELQSEMHLLNLEMPIRQVAADFVGIGLELPSEPIEIIGDPDRIQQLIRNITRNAVQATGSAELVTIRLSRQDHEAIVEIEDRGPGIPEELQDKIFERHVHGSRDGQGLGLEIAQRIAKIHMGRITFTSVPGQTIFRIALPVLEADPEDSEKWQAQAEQE